MFKKIVMIDGCYVNQDPLTQSVLLNYLNARRARVQLPELMTEREVAELKSSAKALEDDQEKEPRKIIRGKQRHYVWVKPPAAFKKIKRRRKPGVNNKRSKKK